MMVFFAVLLIFLRTSKFRHSLTKSFSFWGTSSPDHLLGLSLDPTEDFRPPDLLAPYLHSEYATEQEFTCVSCVENSGRHEGDSTA